MMNCRLASVGMLTLDARITAFTTVTNGKTIATAATRLLRAGLSLAQIAACMGWSSCTVAAMIERYAQVSPEETDEVLLILNRSKMNAQCKMDCKTAHPRSGHLL